MNFPKLLISIVLFAFGLAASAHAETEAKPTPAKPNVIFILADDVGLGDVGFSGGPFKTPHLDALAKSGLHFERCYAMALCGPSRCMLLTGRYPFRTGHVSNQSADALEGHKEIMMPTVLKSAGYATACVGKWGQMPFGPADWGFEESLSFRGSGQYWEVRSGNYIVNGQPKKLREGEYLPDLMHDFAVQFIEKNRDHPFYLYYSMDHIHGPILKTPDSKPGADKDQLYTDNVTYMDKLVGKLLAELDRLKLREKTVVIFAGDNGTARFGVELSTVNGKPISGQKASMLEGGSRVPLAISWPGTAPAGKVLPEVTDFSDFFTTIADLAGAKLPEGVKLDGLSLAPQIRGEKGTPRDWAYVELSGKHYVTTTRWKLTESGELFDMKEAPFKELAVPADSTDPEAMAARKQLQAALDQLHEKSGQPKEKPGKAGKNGKKGKKAGKNAVPETPATPDAPKETTPSVPPVEK